MKKTSEKKPIGNLLLRTLAMPRDTNPAGDIFGGWIMSQMDIAGAILAREIANGRVVTVAIDAMSFIHPVSVGDVVCCYGVCSHVGHTSLKIDLQIWVKNITECENHEKAERFLVTKGSYTYVAVDRFGKPRPLPESAEYIAKYGIDASTVGLNSDGSICS